MLGNYMWMAAVLAGGQTKLVASDPTIRPYFGLAVDVEGSTAVVGARVSPKGGPGTQTGAVYVYESSSGLWSEQAKLTPSDGQPYDYFGNAVAFGGNTALAGAWRHGTGGAVYVFERSASTWTEVHKLVANDAGPLDAFGFSVAFSGDTFVAGAPQNDTLAGIDAGSAYVFVRSGNNWVQQAQLTPAGAGADELFGYSVSVDGDLAVVGAYKGLPGGNEFGAAYVFRRNGTAWSEEAELVSSGGEQNGFGSTLAVSGTTVVAGRLYDGLTIGSAHVFERSGTSWSQTAELVASNAGTSTSSASTSPSAATRSRSERPARATPSRSDRPRGRARSTRSRAASRAGRRPGSSRRWTARTGIASRPARSTATRSWPAPTWTTTPRWLTRAPTTSSARRPRGR